MLTKRNVIVALVLLLVYVSAITSFSVDIVYATEEKPAENTEEEAKAEEDVASEETDETDGLIHNPAFSEYDIKYGIDVSVHNQTIDWVAAAESGVEFAFIRVGGRGWGTGEVYEDTRAIENIQNALDAGVAVGVYFYSQAINTDEVIEEADHCMAVLERAGVGPDDLELPIIIDVEFADAVDENGRGYFRGRLYEAYASGDLDVEVRTELTLAFLERVKSCGYDGGIYAGAWVLSRWHDISRIDRKYKIWIAAWMDECRYDGRYDYWQYSANGIVSGIRGRVDLDVWYTNPTIYSESEGQWKRENGKWYYYTPDNTIETGWLVIGEKRYYMGQDGAMKRGWQKISGRWYYFGWPSDPDSGAMRTGWIKIDDKWYYMGVNGDMKRGLQEIDGKTYYFGWDDNPDSGAMRRGWVYKDGYWRYFGSESNPDSGAMRAGWIESGGNWYYLHPSGVMASHEFINGWWLNDSGSWTYPYKSTWRWSSGGWWYGDDSGWYAANGTYVINGEAYSFDASGWWIEED